LPRGQKERAVSFLIKICGITTPEDARMVVEAGADAIGVNLWVGSKRFVGEAAAAVLAAVPPGILKFGVFVNAEPAEILAAADRLGLDRVQLHGDESAEAFAGFDPARLVRAIRVRDASSLGEADRWDAALFLYDAFIEGYGGGGVPAPWDAIAAEARAPGRHPFLLAGGLGPHNVAEAIRATRPDGVDVASGVESSPGRKDPARVAAFIAAAREAAARAAGEAAADTAGPAT
jgi:phosphoribosylanthranilate isomerase